MIYAYSRKYHLISYQASSLNYIQWWSWEMKCTVQWYYNTVTNSLHECHSAPRAALVLELKHTYHGTNKWNKLHCLNRCVTGPKAYRDLNKYLRPTNLEHVSLSWTPRFLWNQVKSSIYLQDQISIPALLFLDGRGTRGQTVRQYFRSWPMRIQSQGSEFWQWLR